MESIDEDQVDVFGLHCTRFALNSSFTTFTHIENSDRSMEMMMMMRWRDGKQENRNTSKQRKLLLLLNERKQMQQITKLIIDENNFIVSHKMKRTAGKWNKI